MEVWPSREKSECDLPENKQFVILDCGAGEGADQSSF